MLLNWFSHLTSFKFVQFLTYQKFFNKLWLPVANTKPGFVLVLSEYMDHKTTLRLAKEF